MITSGVGWVALEFSFNKEKKKKRQKNILSGCDIKTFFYKKLDSGILKHASDQKL